MDSPEPTMAFLLTAQRDKAAAQHFFGKALKGASRPSPGVNSVDKNAAYAAAFRAWKAEGFLFRRG